MDYCILGIVTVKFICFILTSAIVALLAGYPIIEWIKRNGYKTKYTLPFPPLGKEKEKSP
jgi:hypothetical protein